MERNAVPEGLRCAATYADKLENETPEYIFARLDGLIGAGLISETEAEQILEMLED